MDEQKAPPVQEPDEQSGTKAKPDQAEAPKSTAPADQAGPGAAASPAEDTSQSGPTPEAGQPDPAGQPEPGQSETVEVAPSGTAEIQLENEAALAETIFGSDELVVFADRDTESAKSIQIPLVAGAGPAVAEEMTAGDEAMVAVPEPQMAAAMPEAQEEGEPPAAPGPDQEPDSGGEAEPAEHIEPTGPVEQEDSVEQVEQEDPVEPDAEGAETLTDLVPGQAESEQPESSDEPAASQPGPLDETPESAGQPEPAAAQSGAAAGPQPPDEDTAEDLANEDATAEAGSQTDEPVVVPGQEAEAQPGQAPPVEDGDAAAVSGEALGQTDAVAEPAPLLDTSPLVGNASEPAAIAAEPAPALPAEPAESASLAAAGPKPEPAQAQVPAEVQMPAEVQPPALPKAADAAAKTRRVKKKPAWPRRVLLGAWVVLLVVILATVGWLGWLYVGTNQLAANQAEKLRDEFWQACQNSPGDGGPALEEAGGEESPTAGQAATGVIALVSIPALGLQEWPVVAAEGSAPEELSGSVAWYPDSASPGEVGNTVISGYRITHGQPFADLLRLAAGDEVILETCLAAHHYQIVVPASELTVDASEDWVIDAVPTDPGRLPSAPMITLITSQDLLPTPDRSVAFGKWTGTTTR